MHFEKLIGTFILGLSLINPHSNAHATEAPRIITLAPHMTEMVYDLGLDGQLVARDDASNYPEEAKSLPSVGTGFNPNKELLLLYQPDILLHFTSKIQFIELFPNKHIEAIESNPNSVETLLDDWRRILTLTQQDAKKRAAAEETITAAETKWQRLVEDYKSKEPKKVFFLISYAPVFSLSDMAFLGQAIKGCHVENIFADIPQASFIANPEEILLHEPEVVIHGYSTTEPDGKERAQESALTLFEKIGIELSTEQLVTVDVDILHRPTLRFINALPQICEEIHRL